MFLYFILDKILFKSSIVIRIVQNGKSVKGYDFLSFIIVLLKFNSTGTIFEMSLVTFTLTYTLTKGFIFRNIILKNKIKLRLIFFINV